MDRAPDVRQGGVGSMAGDHGVCGGAVYCRIHSRALSRLLHLQDVCLQGCGDHRIYSLVYRRFVYISVISTNKSLQ